MASKYKDKTIWITGASSGIGEALTINLAAQGAKLIISSRRPEALDVVKEKCGANRDKIVAIEPLDLGSTESVNQAADKVLSSFKSIDYMFHNGGMSQRSLAEETGIEIDRRLMEVNYFGAVALTKRVLPVFIGQQSGHFVVTSSLCGIVGIPLRAAYCASKHALHGYFDTLRAEQKTNGIHVTIACPGFVRTNISLNAIDRDGVATGKMYKAQQEGMAPEVCARKILLGVASKKKEMYIGGKEILMGYFKRYLPPLYYSLAPNSMSSDSE